MDWSSVCPTRDEIEEHFSGLDRVVESVTYREDYPRVEVRVSAGLSTQTWAWDRWHGGGFWHRI